MIPRGREDEQHRQRARGVRLAEQAREGEGGRDGHSLIDAVPVTCASALATTVGQ